MNISTIQIFVLGIVTIIIFYKLIKFYLNDRKVESDFISVVNHALNTSHKNILDYKRTRKRRYF